MATNYNYFGNLVTSGLVLDLDAAKLASYPGSGTTWFDISGNNLTGSLINGPTFTGIGKQAAIVFDGTNDYANVNPFYSLPDLQPGDSITIECWVKRNGSSTSWCPILTKIDPSNSDKRNYEIAFSGTGLNATNNSFSFFYRNSTNTTWNGFSTSATYTDTNWYNFSLTYTMSVSSSAKIYSNGIQVNATWKDGTGNDTPTTTGVGSFLIGTTNNPSPEYFNGNIGNIKIYNRALSAAEVLQNFNALRGRYGI